MTADDYAALPAVLSQPDAVVQRHDGDQERGFLAAINGRIMWAWVKVTKKADEAYVVSYYRARPKAKIIVCTIQTFPFALNAVRDLAASKGMTLSASEQQDL